MSEMSDGMVFFVVLSVLLFIGLGIAMVVIIDNKARIPGGFTSNPFSIIGMRRDHPVISFMTTLILFSIIACLVFELVVTLSGKFEFLQRQEESSLLVIAFWHWYNVHLAPGRFPMQWTFLTGKITREHQIEEHFLEYLRNLVEIPEERRILAEILREKGFAEVPAGNHPGGPVEQGETAS